MSKIICAEVCWIDEIITFCRRHFLTTCETSHSNRLSYRQRSDCLIDLNIYENNEDKDMMRRH